MPSRSPREVQAKAISLLTGMLPMLDAGDPNDRAFKLVTIFLCVCGLILSYNKLIFDAWIPPPSPLPHHMIKCIVYNMPPLQAIEYTGANVSKQGIYQRIARWRKSLAPPNLAQLQAIEEEWNNPPAFSSSEFTAPIEESPTTIDSPSESLLKGGGATKVSPATMQALADGPPWLDPDKTLPK